MSITRVQSNGTASAGNVTSLAATLTSPTTAGNLVIAVIGFDKTSTLGMPTGWTNDAATAADTSHQIALCHWIDVSGGTSSFTFTQTTSNGMTVCLIEAHSTIGWASTVLNQSATNFSGTSVAAFDSGTTAATTVASTFVVAGFTTGSGTGVSAPTNGFTIDLNAISNTGTPTAFERVSLCYKIATATGTQDCGVTNSQTAKYDAVIGAYAESAGGGGGTVNLAATFDPLASLSESIGVTDNLAIAMTPLAAPQVSGPNITDNLTASVAPLAAPSASLSVSGNQPTVVPTQLFPYLGFGRQG